MNTPRIDSGRASTGVRSPIIINQLGAEVRASLIDHWSRPLIIDHPAERPAWDIAPEADVLLTRPAAGWSKAPGEKPRGVAIRPALDPDRVDGRRLLSGMAARWSGGYGWARHLGRCYF